MINRKSAKAKGRRGQTELRVRLLQEFPELEPDDIKCAIGSENGEDIKLSPAAKKIIPYAFEVKYQEKLSLWKALQQAEDNSNGLDPVLVFKRNRSKTYVAIDIDTFMKLIK